MTALYSALALAFLFVFSAGLWRLGGIASDWRVAAACYTLSAVSDLVLAIIVVIVVLHRIGVASLVLA